MGLFSIVYHTRFLYFVRKTRLDTNNEIRDSSIKAIQIVLLPFTIKTRTLYYSHQTRWAEQSRRKLKQPAANNFLPADDQIKQRCRSWKQRGRRHGCSSAPQKKNCETNKPEQLEKKHLLDRYHKLDLSCQTVKASRTMTVARQSSPSYIWLTALTAC